MSQIIVSLPDKTFIHNGVVPNVWYRVTIQTKDAWSKVGVLPISQKD